MLAGAVTHSVARMKPKKAVKQQSTMTMDRARTVNTPNSATMNVLQGKGGGRGEGRGREGGGKGQDRFTLQKHDIWLKISARHAACF